MNVYFVCDGFYPCFVQSQAIYDFDKAMKCYEEVNEYQPMDLFKLNGETGELSCYDCMEDTFYTGSKVYIVVRRPANVNYPETVICDNGIFNKLKDAEDFIALNGGSWKLYSHQGLIDKLNESERIKKEEIPDEDERPF